MSVEVSLLLAVARALGTPLSEDAAGHARHAQASNAGISVVARAFGLRLRSVEVDPIALATLGSPMLIRCSLGWVAVTGQRGRRLTLLLNEGSGVYQHKVSKRSLRVVLGEVSEAYRIDPAAQAFAISSAACGGSPWQRLRALASIERRDIRVIFIYSIAVGITTLAIPVAVQMLVNTVAFSGLVQSLAIIGLALLSFLFLATVLRLARFVTVEYIQRRLFVRFTLDLADRLPQLTRSAGRKKYLPEQVNRFFDVTTLQKASSALLIDGIELLLQTLIGLVLLAVYHPALAAFDLILISGLGIVFGLLGRGASKTTIAESDAKYSVAAWLTDLAAHPDLFRHPVAASQAIEHADTLAQTYVENRRAHFRVVLRQSIGGAVVQITANVSLLLIGGWLVMEGELTLGQLVAAELVVALVVAGMTKIGKLTESFYDLLASVTKLGKLIDLPLESQIGTAIGSDADGASFTLTEKPLEGMISLHADAFARAVVEAARGDSSAAALRLNGQELGDFISRERRRAVWIVDGPALVHGTLRENVMIGSDRGPAKIDEVLGLFGFSVADRERPLLPHGGTLARSETVSLTLARAVLAQPDLLILDRALDGLSIVDRGRLVHSLNATRDGQTTLIITAYSDLELPRWATEGAS